MLGIVVYLTREKENICGETRLCTLTWNLNIVAVFSFFLKRCPSHVRAILFTFPLHSGRSPVISADYMCLSTDCLSGKQLSPLRLTPPVHVQCRVPVTYTPCRPLHDFSTGSLRLIPDWISLSVSGCIVCVLTAAEVDTFPSLFWT